MVKSRLGWKYREREVFEVVIFIYLISKYIWGLFCISKYCISYVLVIGDIMMKKKVFLCVFLGKVNIEVMVIEVMVKW